MAHYFFSNYQLFGKALNLDLLIINCQLFWPAFNRNYLIINYSLQEETISLDIRDLIINYSLFWSAFNLNDSIRVSGFLSIFLIFDQ